MRLLTFAVIASLALASVPVVIGGTASEPEITDPLGDAEFRGGAPACVEGEQCTGPGAVVDFLKVWLVETDDLLTFVIQTSSAEAAKAYGPHTFDAHFTIGDDAYTAGMHIAASDTAPAPVGGSAAATPTGAASAARIATDQYEFDVLRADLGLPLPGVELAGLYLTSELDHLALGQATVTDRAPSTGGVSYTFMLGAPPAPAIVYENITAFPFLVETTNATTGVFQYNWTGDAAFRFVGEVLGGNMTINVTASNETVFAWSGTEGLDEMMDEAHVCVDETVTPVPCQYAFTYTLTDFVGMYGIDLVTEKTLGETNATEGAPGGPAGNGTDEGVDSAADGKESPGFALPLLVIALIVIARRR